MTELVDLSYYQGAVDFAKLATAVSGVILRGGDGTFQDPNLEGYAAGAKANGLTIEAYHYLRTVMGPQAMANECVRTCERVKAVTGAYPDIFWFDMEDVDNDNMSTLIRISWLLAVRGAFVAQLPGITRGLYSGNWYWSSRMGSTDVFSGMLLWTANYPPNVTNGQVAIDAGWGPLLYGGWTRAHTWQYSSTGTRPGVAGGVDCDWRETQPQGGTMSSAEYDELNKRLVVLETTVRYIRFENTAMVWFVRPEALEQVGDIDHFTHEGVDWSEVKIIRRGTADWDFFTKQFAFRIEMPYLPAELLAVNPGIPDPR